VSDEAILIALLRGDAAAARRLVAAELDDEQSAGRHVHLVAARAFASILDADFAVAHRDLVRLGSAGRAADPAVGPLIALAAAMAGIAPDATTPSAEAAVQTVLAVADPTAPDALWAMAVCAEAAMSAGQLVVAESAARRVWTSVDPMVVPTAMFSGQSLMRSLLFQGRLAEAIELEPAVTAAARRHGLASLHLVVLGTMAFLAALRGDRDGLELCVAQIVAESGSCPQTYFTTGAMVLASYALAADGRAGAASEMLLRGAGGPDLPRIQLVDRAYGYELLETAALGMYDVAAARGWAGRARALPGIAEGMTAAALGRIEARLAVAEGDTLTGAALAEQASAIASGRTGYLDATRAQLIAGSALLHDLDSHAPAQEALIAAGGRATQMGAVALAALARRDLRSIGLRITGAAQTSMSMRERQVAELVIVGLSNRQIARSLSISERTVQTHVGGVLRALGLSSRTGVLGAFGSSHSAGAAAPRSVLTARQCEVADLVVDGYTNDGVARALGLSVKTVEKHIGDIYRRLSVDSRAALAARWAREPAAR
jgi:DNA-binding NarL/FixJ family response regulator